MSKRKTEEVLGVGEEAVGVEIAPVETPSLVTELVSIEGEEFVKVTEAGQETLIRL